MFQKRSYFNIIFALIYVMIYLKDGTLNSTAGIFMVIVFNWLALRSYQLDDYRWKIWHYLTGCWSFYYTGYIMYGVINIILSSLEYDFVSNDTLTFLSLSIIFCSVVIFQGINYFYKSLKTNHLN